MERSSPLAISASIKPLISENATGLSRIWMLDRHSNGHYRPTFLFLIRIM